MTDLPRIYLAGSKAGWRPATARRLEGRAVCIDPFAYSTHQSIAAFTKVDLDAVRDCDIVLGVNDYPKYTGMALEFGYAYGLGKRIVLVSRLPRIDSMMVGVASAAFTDLTEALQFIEDRYLPQPEPEPERSERSRHWWLDVNP